MAGSRQNRFLADMIDVYLKNKLVSEMRMNEWERILENITPLVKEEDSAWVPVRVHLEHGFYGSDEYYFCNSL